MSEPASPATSPPEAGGAPPLGPDDFEGLDEAQTVLGAARGVAVVPRAIDELLAVARDELAAPAAAERAAALRVASALFAWDGRGDARAIGDLDGVDHPVARAARRDLALETDDLVALDRLTDEALARGDHASLVTLGELWLLRRRPDRAVVALRAAGSDGSDARPLALALAGAWGELAALLAGSATLADQLAACAIAEDRLGDREAACARMTQALRLARAAGQLDDPYLVERQLALDIDGADALRRKVDALASEPGALAERSAAECRLAIRLGATVQAASLLAGLTAGDGDFGGPLLLALRGEVEAALGGRRAATEALQLRAERFGAVRWAAALSRRAAELCESLGAAGENGAEALWSRLHVAEAGDATAAAGLARVRLRRGDLEGAATVALAHGQAAGDPVWLRRGARALELSQAALGPRVIAVPGRIGGEPVEPPPPPSADGAAGDAGSARARVLAAWSEAAAGDARDPEPLEALVRCARRVGDRVALSLAYQKLAARSADPRARAVWLLLGGALALEAGHHDQAIELLAEAQEADEGDPLAALARGLAAQALGHGAVEAAALEACVQRLASPVARARALRRLAGVHADALGDRRAARASLERALEVHPDDWGTLQALARLHGMDGEWAEAVAVQERAAAAARDEPRTAAELLGEAGALYEHRLADDARATDAYRRALALDGGSRRALAALADLHRRLGRNPELVAVLRRLVEEEPDAAARLATLRELARLAEDDGRVDDAVAALRAALQLDPPGVIAELIALCHRSGRDRDLLEAIAGAPALKGSLLAAEAMADAGERLEAWAEVTRARERVLALRERAGEPGPLLDAARALARLHERLGDLDGAARAWHRVDEVDEADVEAARALQRIYASRNRHADHAAAIERELERAGAPQHEGGGADAPERTVGLWLRLAALRRGSLQSPELAAEAYERALRLGGERAEALQPLAEIYGALGRQADLLRVLERRARITGTDGAARSDRVEALVQIGDLRDRGGDGEGALAAWREAFDLDPANRAAFTALERACYRRELWREALDLYRRAIEVVELHKVRAYRLGDLYARCGQVQLSYLGDADAAAASYLQLLECDPESDVAQAALERIFDGRGEHARLLEVYERRAESLRDDARRAGVLRRAARLAAERLGDRARAATLYARLLAADPADPESLDALARYHEQAGDHARLVGLLRSRATVTSSTPEAIALHQRIAELCEDGLRDVEGAVDAWRRILDLAPSHRAALEALARLYEGSERWADLVEVSRRQARVVTDRAQKALVYFRCGSVMESKFGKDDEAIRYYEAAIRVSSTCLPAVHGLRDLYRRREDWPRVVQTLELEAKLWTDDKERAGIYAHIGVIHAEKLGDGARALRYFEEALEVDRECVPANRALFELHFARGDYARALPLGALLTQKVMREGDPTERSEFYRKRAVAARALGAGREAAESLVVALEVRPENLEALELLVEMAGSDPEAWDYGATLAQLDRLYRKRAPGAAGEPIEPGGPAARLLARVAVGQAALAERQVDLEAAAAALEEALRLAPDDFPVLDARVGAWLRLRRDDDATVALERFLAAPRDRRARELASLRLAEVLADHVMAPERAVAVLQSVLADEPEHAGAHLRLAQELYLLGRFAEAQQVCDRLIEIAAAPARTAAPEELSRYYHYLGRIAEAQGDGPAAARNYRRAIDLDPAYPPPVRALARRFAVAGDPAQGIALLERAGAALPATAVAARAEMERGLARLHVTFGERHTALRILSSLVAGGQGTDDDHALLAEELVRFLLADARDRLP